jgi:hypothetical protein
MECYTLQGISKNHIVCNGKKKVKPQRFTILLEILCKKFHPNWVTSHHPFDDVNMIEVCLQSSTPLIMPSPMYWFLIHIAT